MQNQQFTSIFSPDIFLVSAFITSKQAPQLCVNWCYGILQRSSSILTEQLHKESGHKKTSGASSKVLIPAAVVPQNFKIWDLNTTSKMKADKGPSFTPSSISSDLYVAKDTPRCLAKTPCTSWTIDAPELFRCCVAEAKFLLHTSTNSHLLIYAICIKRVAPTPLFSSFTLSQPTFVQSLFHVDRP